MFVLKSFSEGVGINPSIIRLDRCGNTIGVPTEWFEASGVQIPWLDPSKMVRWLVDTDQMHLLHGNIDLPEFWKRFATFQPDHAVFTSGRSLRRVIPFLSHGDEGRTKKKRGFLVWSFRSVAGSGTRFFRSRPLEEQASRMPLNLDNSLRSRFLHVGVPNKIYHEREDVWQAIASRIGQAYNELEKVGFEYNGFA